MFFQSQNGLWSTMLSFSQQSQVGDSKQPYCYCQSPLAQTTTSSKEAHRDDINNTDTLINGLRATLIRVR